MAITQELRKNYVTTYHSIGGPKAVLLVWNDELDMYEPWQTGPGMKTPEQARQYAKDWAKAEGIEFK